MASNWLLLLGVLATSSLSAVHGGRILLMLIPDGSHLMNFLQIGQALIDRGHDVHTVVDGQCAGSNKLANIGVKVHKMTTKLGCFMEDKEIQKEQMDMLLAPFSFTNAVMLMRKMGRYINNEVDAVYTTPSLIDQLRDLKFDLSIVDGLYFVQYLYLLPYKLDIPVVSLLALFNPRSAGVPALPSFSPQIADGIYSDRMTFAERLQNSFKTLTSDVLYQHLNPGADNSMVTKYVPEKPYKSIAQIVSESILWFIMTDVAIDYPRVSMPHVINIGGLNTRPPKPLPADIQEIADDATDGLILVSFGSAVADFPAELRARIYADLKQVTQTVLWRYTGDPFPDLPDNIKLVKWLPQIDLLAHPNTKVFVTHCGCNGQFEALYHGVPMVGVPLFGDQIYNAVRMARKGMGIRVDTFNFPPGTLAESIEEVLSNESYSRAAKRLSSLFRDRPMTPIETVTYWIEHVLTHGSDHLVPASLHLSWYQFWCLDVIAVFLLVSILTACACVKCVKWICRLCSRCLRNLRSRPKEKFQ